jgi:hypothetical protein
MDTKQNTSEQDIFMETASEMQNLISQIVAKHGLEIGAAWNYLLLEQPDRTTLHIENTRKNEVGIVEVGIKDGQSYIKPYALFFTGYEEWVPIAYARYNFPTIHEDNDGFIYVAGISEDRTRITYITHRDEQLELAEYCEGWAREMVATDWLEKGICKRIGTLESSGKYSSMLPVAS